MKKTIMPFGRCSTPAGESGKREPMLRRSRSRKIRSAAVTDECAPLMLVSCMPQVGDHSINDGSEHAIGAPSKFSIKRCGFKGKRYLPCEYLDGFFEVNEVPRHQLGHAGKRFGHR